MPSTGISPALAKTRSHLAVAVRRGDAGEIVAAKREHAAARLADYIRKTVESAPPLTDEQRDRLAGLLSGGPNVA